MLNLLWMQEILSQRLLFLGSWSLMAFQWWHLPVPSWFSSYKCCIQTNIHSSNLLSYLFLTAPIFISSSSNSHTYSITQELKSFLLCLSILQDSSVKFYVHSLPRDSFFLRDFSFLNPENYSDKMLLGNELMKYMILDLLISFQLLCAVTFGRRA